MIIPVYNEARTLERCVRRILDTPPPVGPDGGALERVIVLVDDGSTDGSREAAGALGTAHAEIDVVLHRGNRGKGAAVATGLARALERGADVLLIHDADLEYDPADHAAAVAPILRGDADAVIGSRYAAPTRRVTRFWHRTANRGLTLISNMLSGLDLTDMECCTKVFTREVAERLAITETSFALEPELVANLARLRLEDGQGLRRLRIWEVPVSYDFRSAGEGKKITWRDGLDALRAMLKHNL